MNRNPANTSAPTPSTTPATDTTAVGAGAADACAQAAGCTDRHGLALTLELAARLGHRSRGVGDLLRDGVSIEALLSADAHALGALTPAVATALRAGAGKAPDSWQAPACAPGAPIPRGDDGGAAPFGLDDAKLSAAAWQLAAALAACEAQCLPFSDARYPQSLRDIDDPPPWLFCRGDPDSLQAPMVAMVGSRRASHAGLELAHCLGERLARGGYTISSGLALGIDGAAHRGALKGGKTVAVLGTGIDEVYPQRHTALAAEVLRRGCLISELPPGTAPHRGQFPRRNRIVSGLAEATVIVEAALPSGSLHTAAAALEQGREVFVLPWSLLHRGGAGCLRLLRDGATPLTSIDELEEHFPLLGRREGTEADAETPLLALIGDGELGLETLCDSSGMDSVTLLTELGRLEAAGLVRRGPRGYLRAHCKTCVPPGNC